MNHKHVFTAAIVCALAVPAWGQGLSPQHMARRTVGEAAANARAAAAAASAASANEASARKLADDYRAGRVRPPERKFLTQFNVASVKPHLDNQQKLLGELKLVGTSAQAGAYADKFKADYPRLEADQKRFTFALQHYSETVAAGTKSADVAQAEPLLKDVEANGVAIEAEMDRIEKLNPAAQLAFKRWRDLND